MSLGSLPPGAMGPPLIGETLSFMRDPFHFLTKRQQRHGNIYKSNVVGRRVVFLAGTQGAEAFYNDENITRSHAHFFPIVDLFGGINMEMFDGPRHFALKSMALTAFDRAAIAGYLPDVAALIESTLQRLEQRTEFSAIVELRKLAIAAICWNVMGLPEGSETEAIARDYGLVLTGITSLPIPIPGTPYGRAHAARDRVLARIRRVIAARRARPGSDAISRMLTARAADGSVYSDAAALLEVHHIFIAGYIVYGLMAEALRQLAVQPALRELCAAEIRDRGRNEPLTLEMLESLSVCTNIALETKRVVPLVPLAFGRAKRDFTVAGFRVPQDWTVCLALHLNNRDATIYTNPDRFDPDRFALTRAEHHKHPLAFIPQGAEPPTGHRCLGLDYSTILVLTFIALVVRGYDWELPPQRLDYNWRTLPPEPFDGMRVRLRARHG